MIFIVQAEYRWIERSSGIKISKINRGTKKSAKLFEIFHAKSNMAGRNKAIEIVAAFEAKLPRAKYNGDKLVRSQPEIGGQIFSKVIPL